MIFIRSGGRSIHTRALYCWCSCLFSLSVLSCLALGLVSATVATFTFSCQTFLGMSFVIPSDLLELASGYIGSGWVLVLIFLAHMEAQILVTFFLFILPYFCTLYLCNTYNAGNVPLGELNPPLPVIATNVKRGNPSTPYSLVACTPCTGSTTHGKYARVKYSTSCKSSPYSQGGCPDRHHHHRRNRLDLTIVR